MNIEIANRLVELRKRNNLSQEALAEKLGISRQAVSKWERAEASPDTDNLILLARLYQISLDDLLKIENVPPASGLGMENIMAAQGEADQAIQGGGSTTVQNKPEQEAQSAAGKATQGKGQQPEEGNREPAVQREVKTIIQKEADPTVQWDEEPVVIIEEERPKFDYSILRHFPVYIVAVMAFVISGALWNVWHPGWMLLFLPPIWQTGIMALEKKDPRRFAYPVLVVLIYLCLGFFGSLWHPGWIIFLTIPLYYPLMNYFRKVYKMQKKELDDMLQGTRNR